jgi:hypothetical protein
MARESLVNMALGSEADGVGNMEPEKRNASSVMRMIPNKMRRSPITETTLANMDVRIGFTTGIEKTVNCPKA